MTTWTKIKWGLRVVIAIFVAMFLHYVLPQHDTVQITNTYNRLTSVGGMNSIFYASEDAGSNTTEQRDIRFIEAKYANGNVIIYRNEDTGWIWPPYFKYDSSNLQAEAGNLKSSDTSPKWAIVTHYGWRVLWLTAYPNAVSVRAATGPDDSIFPWVNIMILTVLGAVWLLLWRMWAQFRERTIDPLFASAEETFDKAGDTAGAAREKVGGVFSGFGRWLATWRRK
ncbi:MAG: DUF1523 family protein [Deltaproteobacteria bacterium]